MKFYKLIFLMFFTCLSCLCTAQIEEQYYQSFLSPNASSLHRFNDIPVSKYNGTIDLNIPVFEVKDNFIGLNLGLAYNSGGNKVEDIASWVGLGWNLTGIPRISRQVRGLPDESLSGIMSIYQGKTMKQYTETNLLLTDELEMGVAYMDGHLDTQTDIFFLSIPGFSGKFYFDQVTNKFWTEKLTNIKIAFNPLSSVFTVTDDQGVTYNFNVLETSNSSNASVVPSVISSWLPNEISYPSSGRKITFNYTAEHHVYHKIGDQNRYIEIQRLSHYEFEPMIDSYPIQLVTAVAYNISSIVFNGGRVDFVPGDSNREDLTGGRNLKQVLVSNSKNELIKKIDLSYSYLTGGESNAQYGANKWMLLSTANFWDVSGTLPKQQYTFNYKEADIPSSRLSYAQDYWGFYNGVVENNSLIPTTFYKHPVTGNTVVIDGANRYVRPLYADFGILKQVTYPTGGRTNFKYESNDVWQADAPGNYVEDGVFIAAEGGDQNGPEPSLPPVHQEYVATFTIQNPPDTYLNNENQNGCALLNAEVANIGVTPGHMGASLTVRGLSPSNSHVYLTFYSSFVNYYLPNGDYELKAVFDQNPPNYMDFHCFLTWFKMDPSATLQKYVGGLRIKEVDSYTSGATLASNTAYQYTTAWDAAQSSGRLFGNGEFQFGKIITKKAWYWEVIAERWHQTGARYFRIRANPNAEMITQNSSCVGYSSVYEIKKIGETGMVTHSKYSNDPDEVNPMPPYLPAQSLKEHNGLLLEKTAYSLLGQTLSPVSKSIYYYDLILAEHHLYNLYPDMYNNSSIGVPPPLFNSSKYNLPKFYPYSFQRTDARLLEQVDSVYNAGHAVDGMGKVNVYNDLGQLVSQEQSGSGNSSLISRFYYPNTIMSLPQEYEQSIAWMLANNMLGKQIRIDLLSKKTTNEKLLKRNSLYYKQFNNTPNAYYMSKSEVIHGGETQASSFDFISYDGYGNPLEVLDKTSLTTVYLWGYNGQYPVAKIVNATYAEVLSVLGQTAINNLNAVDVAESTIRNTLQGLRAHSSMEKSTVSDYTYKPLVGMSSMTDPRGITERYEYDGFQRLRDVFDFDSNLLRKYQYNYRP